MGIFESVFTGFNIFGLGSDPLFLIFAVVVSLIVTQKELRMNDYTNTVIVFLMAYSSFFFVGVITSVPLFAALVVLGGLGVILKERSVRK